MDIGTSQTPLLVPEFILCDLSPGIDEILAIAKANPSAEGFRVALPDDDHKAWTVLIHWLVRVCLSNEAEVDQLLLVRCWALGEKYELKSFRDEVMLAMLLFCDDEMIEVETVRRAFELTKPGSKLRCLMAEELLYRVGQGRGEDHELDDAGIDRFEKTGGAKVAGLTTALLKARKECSNAGEGYMNRFARKRGSRHGRWKDFLVGDGQFVHGRAIEREEEHKANA